MFERGGLVGRFEGPDALLQAARRVRALGLSKIEAYTPFAVTGLSETLGAPVSPVRRTMFIGAAIGLIAGVVVQAWSAAVDYPINSGGRPLLSWPAFIPVIFELMVLFAALAGFGSFLRQSRLLSLHQPIFDSVEVERASIDCFLLVVDATDSLYDAEQLQDVFTHAGALAIEEVRR